MAFSFSPHPHGAPSEQTRRGFQLFIEALANRLGCRHAADPEQFSRVEPNAQETVQMAGIFRRYQAPKLIRLVSEFASAISGLARVFQLKDSYG